MQLFSGLQCTHTHTHTHTLVLNMSQIILFVYFRQFTPLLRPSLDLTVIDTPRSQGPISSPGGTMVVHWVNTCAFVIPLVPLRSRLDINSSAGKLKLMQSDDEFHKGDMGCSPVQLGNVSPTLPHLPTIRYLG